MLYGNFTTEAVQYGIESEDKAVGLYIKEMQYEEITVEVNEVGLLLSKKKPFLGESLDRVITNLDTNKKWGMEIKSPFSKAGMTVEDACKTKNFFLENLVMELSDSKEHMTTTFKSKDNCMLPTI